MEPANFSRAVLERAENLAVLPVSGTGWSDWGNPERIFQSLEGTRELATDPYTAALLAYRSSAG